MILNPEFGSCCRAAARPACRQHVLLHRLGVQLLLKRSGFGIGRDRWCIRVRGCGATCVALAHREPWSDWPAAAGAASTADTAGPFSVGAAAAAAGALASAVRRRAASSSHRRRCLGARGASRQHASRGRLPLRSSKAAVYEDSSCLARKVAMVSDISGWQALDRPTGKLAVCIVCCRIRCIENCCIRPKIAV